MNAAVTKAIEELKGTFPDGSVSVLEDGQGGAWFFIEWLDPGPVYENRKIWVGADISAQYPYADIYPIFVSGELKRADGHALGEAMSQNIGFHGKNAVQISRRSNHRDPGLETAAMKIQKVLAWLTSR